jgi:hypothetical protein
MLKEQAKTPKVIKHPAMLITLDTTEQAINSRSAD